MATLNVVTSILTHVRTYVHTVSVYVIRFYTLAIDTEYESLLLSYVSGSVVVGYISTDSWAWGSSYGF